jgi:hypothetical protein
MAMERRHVGENGQSNPPRMLHCGSAGRADAFIALIAACNGPSRNKPILDICETAIRMSLSEAG